MVCVGSMPWNSLWNGFVYSKKCAEISANAAKLPLMKQVFMSGVTTEKIPEPNIFKRSTLLVVSTQSISKIA